MSTRRRSVPEWGSDGFELRLVAFPIALTLAFRFRLEIEGPAGFRSDRSANLRAEFVSMLGSDDEFAEQTRASVEDHFAP